jgi:hypothetical protein
VNRAVRTTTFHAALLVAALLFATPALADNNNFANATRLPYGATDATVNNATGTTEVGESLTAQGGSDRNACIYGGDTTKYSQAKQTFWWWVVGTGRRVTVTTDGSTFDTHLGIFPGGLNDTAASCLDSSSGFTETLSFDTAAGAVYHIQVGACAVNTVNSCFATTTGQIHVLATSPAAANDNQASAAPLPTGQSTIGDNWAATEESGEQVSCRGQPYGRTVWYRWHAPAVGSATIAAADPNAAIAVYTSAGALVDCEAAPGGDAHVTANVTPGDYLVQVGGVGAHSGLASDSASGRFSVLASFTENSDRDGDGDSNATDCKPDDPAIHHGAVDTPRDGIDEDCVGGDANWPRVSSRLFGFFTPFSDGSTRVDKVYVQRVPAGARIVITCHGRGCPPKRKLKSRTVRKSTSRINVDSALRHRKLRPGAKLELRITRKGWVGVAAVWAMRSRQQPKRADRCTRPGASRLLSCGRV